MKKYTAIFSTALIALVLFGSSCGATERDAATEPMMAPEASPTPGQAAGATHTVAEITSAPNAMIGKTVMVVADVDEVYGPRAFKLDADDEDSPLVEDDDELLALVPKVGGFPTIDNQWNDGKARVTGVVQRMVVKDIEREIGWELPSELESEFKGKPVLIVRSVERLNR